MKTEESLECGRHSTHQQMEEIGKRLASLRKKKGYTSHETFALDHGLPRAQYWRLEKGRANFTVKTLVRILKIHDLTLESFFCNG